jgi:hypothetical protein
MKAFPVLAVTFFALLASFAEASIQFRTPPAHRCAPGTEPDSFSLAAQTKLPSIQGLELPPFDKPAFRKVKAPDVNENLRLDVCLRETSQGTELTLHRAVLMGMFSSIAEVSVPADAVVEGLSQAIFGTGIGTLRIDIPFHEQLTGTHRYPRKESLLVRGGQGFVVAAVNHKEKGQLVSNLLVGDLVEGDALAGKLCGPQHRQEERTLTLGTAKLELTVCIGGAGTSGTFPYSFARVSVTDASDHLPAGLRGKRFTVQDATELKRVFPFKVNHHNTCDSFALHLPHAIYAATSFTGSPPDSDRCDHPRVVEDAPTGTLAEHHGGIGYRIHYQGGATLQDDKLGCRLLIECQ